MPSYTELLRENKVGDVDCTGDDQVWKIVKPKVLYRGGETYMVPLLPPQKAVSVIGKIVKTDNKDCCVTYYTVQYLYLCLHCYLN